MVTIPPMGYGECHMVDDRGHGQCSPLVPTLQFFGFLKYHHSAHPFYSMVGQTRSSSLLVRKCFEICLTGREVPGDICKMFSFLVSV